MKNQTKRPAASLAGETLTITIKLNGVQARAARAAAAVHTPSGDVNQWASDWIEHAMKQDVDDASSALQQLAQGGGKRAFIATI